MEDTEKPKKKRTHNYNWDYLMVLLIAICVIFMFSFLLVSVQLKRETVNYESIVNSYNAMAQENRQYEININNCLRDLKMQERKADYYFEGYLSSINNSGCKK